MATPTTLYLRFVYLLCVWPLNWGNLDSIGIIPGKSEIARKDETTRDTHSLRSSKKCRRGYLLCRYTARSGAVIILVHPIHSDPLHYSAAITGSNNNSSSNRNTENQIPTTDFSTLENRKESNQQWRTSRGVVPWSKWSLPCAALVSWCVTTCLILVWSVLQAGAGISFD